MVSFRVSKFIRTDKARVYSWWTDFQPDDPHLSGRILKKRRIISKTLNFVEYEDEGTMLGVSFKDRVKVFLNPPESWTAQYESDKFNAIAKYSLHSRGDGTEIREETEVSFKGWLKLFGRLVRPLIEARIRDELEDYSRIIEGQASTRS